MVWYLYHCAAEMTPIMPSPFRVGSGDQIYDIVYLKALKIVNTCNRTFFPLKLEYRTAFKLSGNTIRAVCHLLLVRLF